LLSSLKELNRPIPVIYGISGTSLKKDEAAFFKKANPLGFILFARNCKNPEQVERLTKSLHKCMGRDVPILIDQEGGRVARFKSPVWKDRPAAKSFGDKYKRSKKKTLEALNDNTVAIAEDLRDAGVNVNCSPVLDVLTKETHNIIGDRAFSKDVEVVSDLGKQVCYSYLSSGIIPVMKHIPGHGRASSDSHKELPVVQASLDELEKNDFIPFKAILSQVFSEAVWGMVAHVVYKEIDDNVPSSCSRRVIYDVIRDKIGFRGLLLSDDIGMEALKDYGSAERRAEAVLRAGCDIVLHCNGNLDEMKAIADKLKIMGPETIKRYNKTVDYLEQLKPA
jgi:beta-N-acetylhexosaminidase